MVPTIISGALVAPPDVRAGAQCARDAAPAVAHFKAERAKDCSKKGVVLHASPATAAANDPGVELHGVQRDGLVCGIVEYEILERDVTCVVPCQGPQQGQSMLFGSGLSRVFQDNRVEVLLWQLEALEIVAQLGIAVAWAGVLV